MRRPSVKSDSPPTHLPSDSLAVAPAYLPIYLPSYLSVDNSKVGQPLTVKIIRQRKSMSITVIAGELSRRPHPGSREQGAGSREQASTPREQPLFLTHPPIYLPTYLLACFAYLPTHLPTHPTNPPTHPPTYGFCR